MINILMADPRCQSRASWIERIKASPDEFRLVQLCETFSEMTAVLTQQKVDLILCSCDLLRDDQKNIFAVIVRRHPRISVVLYADAGFRFEDLPTFSETGVVFRRGLNEATLGELLRETNKARIRQIESDPDVIELSRRTAQGITAPASRLLRLLFENETQSASTLRHLLREAAPDILPPYTVIVGRMEYAAPRYSPENASLVDIALLKARRIFSENSFIASMSHGYDQIELLVGGSATQRELLQRCNAVAREVALATPATIIMGIGNTVRHAEDIPRSYREARTAARSSCLFGIDCAIHISFLRDSSEIGYYYPLIWEEWLAEQTLLGDASGAQQILDDIFLSFRSIDTLPAGMLGKILLGMVVRLNLRAMQRTPALEKLQMDGVSLNKLLGCTSVEEAYHYMTDLIRRFSEEMNALLTMRCESLFLRVAQYVKAAGGREVSIEELCLEFGTTFHQLNQAMVDGIGMNAVEYLSR